MKIFIAFLIAVSMAKAVNCPNGVKVCIAYKDEPLWKRAYFINMTGDNIRIRHGSIWTNNRHTSLNNRIFNRYSKTVIAEAQKVKSKITKMIIEPIIFNSSFQYERINNKQQFKPIERPINRTSNRQKIEIEMR
ncbi:hypothetical protein JWV37_10375 [Sulfurospirillum sp. T05]|uniref:Uncharacterized protein n=1 Tax=Sulfurospirillum tamanense TaxID=2813362 RepID=A0ABS2WU42_9BACT|nr:hypothetical protein [Sulfurospirillum tamanensis]MBN2965187.1 hypothetical protein [Sulfurospirillum tamanensis]